MLLARRYTFFSPTVSDSDDSGDSGNGEDVGSDSWVTAVIDTVSGWFGGIAEGIGNALQSIATGLTEVRDSIVESVLSIPDKIKSGIEELFTPTIDLKTELVDKFNEKIPLDVLIQGKDNIMAIFNGISTRVPTVVIPLSNTSLGSYGVGDMVINFTWFEPYRDTVHGIISGILWLTFMVNQFFNTKSLINATANGAEDMVDMRLL